MVMDPHSAVHVRNKISTEFILITQTSQDLRILSTVTLNCQVTKVVMNSGSQLSELQTVSQMSQVCRIVLRRNCERTLPHTIQNVAPVARKNPATGSK